MAAERAASRHGRANAALIADCVVPHLVKKAAVMREVFLFVRVVAVDQVGKFPVEYFFHDLRRDDMLVERRPLDFDVSAGADLVLIVRGKTFS
jgi:hypothetical protein